ncbi:ABC transporter ATP-binding protein [Verminephrobacter eiseniae]|uniref:ABC transporter ATP-binding protein n=1 Tax=Verminephrobacter eiseniae TaxID=364317 RepID=UPI002238B60D|nr:ABC transporter ATP-binding protein [Verminephrobacter eiseniae]MCW5232803.1 ATP-binding cassette domain-containing protein [Verminephrobacter eiseniae]MCW5295633.1 ATP-binding cassette domain-containing protein [Verminephrobacter eiseniae]MCW8184761.1 ATP-binding cassette domain-containing protein [Verminephrobacter eiseniae]MCW8221751.1 ATP-binding cassette domain-containing protein [Verminephrobacter eiseniae]MCW8232560.1 ATP-binding cassette domain-containing protein [Verminephrobacter 
MTTVPALADTAADALNCQGVHKRFAARSALAGVSLRVRRGEFVALLGPNGAGKTTLFQILTGLFVQDEGQVSVMGADMRAAPVQALAHIGIVFQQPAIDLDLSVEANLRFHADLHGLSRQQANARMAPLLARLGLGERRRTRVRELSGGNRRKVELMRALLHQPDLLLMDEATVGLDPGSRMQIVTEARRLATHSQVGILWATHLVPEVEVSDRVVVLHHGLVRFDGAPAQLLRTTGGASLEAAFLSLTGTANDH